MWSSKPLCSLLVLALLIATGSCSSRSRTKEKDRKKEKYNFTIIDNNMCSIEDNTAAMHCLCDSIKMGNATEAKCWIFTGLTPDHRLWNIFPSQPHIAELTITVRPGGQFTFVPTRGLRHLRELQMLEIKYANIPEIHTFAFANLTVLKEISMSRNQIVGLNEYAFAHLPNLTEITMDENRIAELKRDVFVDLPVVQKLFIAQNNLSVIHDGAFRHLASLLELELDSNYLNVLTRDTFTGLSGLKRLDLTSNKISMLGDLTFAELWSLEALLLDINQIEFISERAFAGLTQLKRLTLSENHLRFLGDRMFDGVQAISFLDLRSNELQTLTIDNVRPIIHNLFNDTSYFYLDKNKFVCDCRLSWMHSLRNETKNERVRNALDELTCYLDGMQGVTAASVTSLTRPLGHFPFAKDDDQYEDKENDEGYVYDQQQQDSSHGYKTMQSQHHHRQESNNPSIKHLFQIPLEELPCPSEQKATTEQSNVLSDIYKDTMSSSSSTAALMAITLVGALVSSLT